MKKFLLVATLATGIGLSMSTSAEVITRKYYGTKANNSAINPCKGTILYLCGEITTQTWIDKSNILSTQTMVRNTVVNPENKIIATEEYTTDLTPRLVLDDIIKKLPENAVITNIDYNEKGTGD